MQRGDLYLASFPFGDTAAMKLRPVLLLTGTIGVSAETIVVYISSVIPGVLLPSDILLDPSQPEHASTGLKVASVLRLHKLATIHRSSIQRHLGTLSAATLQEVESRLRSLLSL